jgi:hypothetical protein
MVVKGLKKGTTFSIEIFSRFMIEIELKIYEVKV